MGKYSQVCTITSRTNADNSEMDQEASSRVLRTHSREQVSMSERRSASMSREHKREDGRGMGKEYKLFLVCDAERTEVVMCETWGHRLICA